MIRTALPKSDRRVSSDSAWPLHVTPTREPTKARVSMRDWIERNHRRTR